MSAILYARHGESTWNAAGRWQGQADPPLSARGRAQAEALADRLFQRLGAGGISLLATSPLARARATAEIVGARFGVAPRRAPGLRELDAGRWSGLTRAEVERRFGLELARFRAGGLDVCAGGASESRRALRARVVAALRELVAAGPGPLVVVGHLGALRSLRPDVELANAEVLELPAALVAEPVEDRDGERRSAGGAR